MTKIPSKSEILKWISENPTKNSKRDIARAFGIKGADRIDLKRVLKKLESGGQLQKRKKSYRDPNKLPPVSVLRILTPDQDGDLFAQPLEWQGADTEPRILMRTQSAGSALGEGDRILARLSEVDGEDFQYEGRLIRKLGSNPITILGVFKSDSQGGRIVPIDRGVNKEWRVANRDVNGAKDGELVEAERVGPSRHLGSPSARVVEILGDPSAPKAVSLIAIHQHGIPDRFPDAVIAEADETKAVSLGNRQDLRDLPLVTIDPADARDHDDAVCAQADADPKNKNGHIVWVAIADVAAYVKPGSALDKEALLRGNSTYFPDRVVPMLPDRLSGNLCSLHEGVERACLAVKVVLNAKGEKISHSFFRGFMKSAASFNYKEVQSAQDGLLSEKTGPFAKTAIAPLFAAYRALCIERENRQPLDLDLPERRIQITADGKVSSVALHERLDAHRMIEEFMVLANVAAAEDLVACSQPLLFRVHEEPTREKLDALRDVSQASGFTLAKGQVLKTRHLNALLHQAKDTDFDELINISTLRSMTRAYYSAENLGHFGLALRSYAHFTSPIRRYADLVVHRALIAAHGWGNDGLQQDEIAHLDETAARISESERRSMNAERDTSDRYLAAFLNEKVGAEFTGSVSGVTKFGAFVKLDETGADGLIPIRTLGREYFKFDADAQTLIGSDTGFTIRLGQRAVVKLSEAIPITGGLRLELVSVDGSERPKSQSRKPDRKRSAGRKVSRRRK